ncbi:MAG: PKD-like family lipoprotein [Mangrovibacterium sp.]
MKKIFLYMTAVALTVGACTEDKGTYDYTDLNEVKILGMEDAYEAKSGEAFTITPELDYPATITESEMEFLWYAYLETDLKSGVDTLSFERDLDIDSLTLGSNDYTLVYKVFDTKTGIYYKHTSNLDVSGFADGLHVLSNKAGNAQVSILRGVGEGLSDFNAYADANDGAVAGAKPVAIQGVKKYMVRTTDPVRMAIVCNDATMGVYANINDFKKTTTLAAITQFTNPMLPPPTGMSSVVGFMAMPNASSGCLGIFLSAPMMGLNAFIGGVPIQPDEIPLRIVDNIEGNYGGSLTGGVNTAGFSPNFQVAYGSGGGQAMFYSMSTRGFYLTTSTSTDKINAIIADEEATEEPVFDVTNTGLDVIYGKKVDVYSMGVFKDPSDATKKYILALSGIVPAMKFEIEGENMGVATHFEFMNAKQIMYYAYENKIYTYDLTAKRVKYTYELPEGALVDKIEMSADDESLFVGFSDGTTTANTGSVHVLELDLDGEILSVKEEYNNKFGKIVDFFEN